jgi:hypothetical protein
VIFADSSKGVCPVISLQYQYFLDDKFIADTIRYLQFRLICD